MKIGLIGCGGIGQLRAEAAIKAKGIELSALCDVDLSRAKILAAQYGGLASDDWRVMVQSDEVEAVIVSTPPSLHAEMCIEALRAGKHVLCEKPLARTTQECEAVLAAARESNRFLATGFNYRFYPSMVKAREILDSGIIGDLDHIRSYTGYSAQEHDHEWLHDINVMGGGALRDNGIHLIDLTCYFLGGVAEVKGFTTNHVWGYDGCEDNGFALLRNEQGRVATLQASWTEWRRYQLLIEIYGSRGCIRAWCFPMMTQVIWAKQTGGPTERKMHWFPKTQLMEKLKSYQWVVVQSFVHELGAFVEAVQGTQNQIATGQDGALAVQVADMAGIRESSATNQVQEIRE